MRILLLGKMGQLGWEIERIFSPHEELVTLDYPEIDFTCPEETKEKIETIHADMIINAVAYTDVDRAETEPEKARLINVAAVEKIASIAREQSAVLVHFSTDYVFDGTKKAPYIESDATNPINTYGQTKRQGEEAIQNSGCPHWIIRTSWLYSTRRDNFVLKVLQWVRKYKTIKVVTDQISNPTWARTLALATKAIVDQAHTSSLDWVKEQSGIYHVAGGGYANRHDWALEIMKNDPHPEEHLVNEVLPAKSSDFRTPAQRPLFTALDCEKFENVVGYKMPCWKDDLFLAVNGEL